MRWLPIVLVLGSVVTACSSEPPPPGRGTLPSYAGCTDGTGDCDAGGDATDAGGDATITDATPADSQPIPWDQGGYPCGAVTTYPFDGGSLDSGSSDAGDDGGLSLEQCRSLCAGAPGGVRACYIGDAGTTLVCQAPECG